MYRLLRGLMFQLDPERAHELALSYLSTVQGSSWWRSRWRAKAGTPDPRLAMEALGVSFPAPLGMAAGFDKTGRCYNALLALGYGHVEVGTVTPEGQPGNPRPRIERFPDHHALVNRLGFNNPGVGAVRERLEAHPPEGVIGVNVGRNKTTAPEDALDDYTSAAAALARWASYVTVNVSSPNTPGLRNLQAPAAVAELVTEVQEAIDDAGAPRPVLLKLHPDAPVDELAEAAEAAVDAGAAGIIAVNTTTERPEDLGPAGEGGLSGRPLKQRATQVIAGLRQALDDEVLLVGVGGIETGQDALERIQAGATLVQAYTGFIYRGPRFPQKVHREMLAGLDELGVDRLEELVGQRAKALA